jgi:uncharacterized membrane protein
MPNKISHLLAAASLIALVFLCLAWELWGAPLRPGGSWWGAIKALPLLAPLRGVLAGRRYTFRWAMMLMLPYFIEGVVRGYAENMPARTYALGEVALSACFFVSALVYLRSARGVSAETATGSAK